MYVFLKSSPTPKKSPLFNTWTVRNFFTTFSLLSPFSVCSVKLIGGSFSRILPEEVSFLIIAISLTTLHFPDWMKYTSSAGPSILPRITCNKLQWVMIYNSYMKNTTLVLIRGARKSPEKRVSLTVLDSANCRVSCCVARELGNPKRSKLSPFFLSSTLLLVMWSIYRRESLPEVWRC